MPIPLRVSQAPTLEPAMRRVLDKLRESGAAVVDEAWLRANPVGVADYAQFKERFTALLRASVRARFIREGKSDEFAVSLDGKHVTYVIISLKDFDRSVAFKAAD